MNMKCFGEKQILTKILSKMVLNAVFSLNGERRRVACSLPSCHCFYYVSAKAEKTSSLLPVENGGRSRTECIAVGEALRMEWSRRGG